MPRGALYDAHVRLQSYRLMLELAKRNLKSGKHPILEGNYTKEIIGGYIEEIVDPFFKSPEGTGYKRKLIFCWADEETIRKRLTERNAERDLEKLKSEQSWREFLQKEPILPLELARYDSFPLNTTQPLEQNLPSLINYLTR